MIHQLIVTLIVGNQPKFLLEAIINTTFDAVSTKPKIHILLSSKVHIILEIQHTKMKYLTCPSLFQFSTCTISLKTRLYIHNKDTLLFDIVLHSRAHSAWPQRREALRMLTTKYTTFATDISYLI